MNSQKLIIAKMERDLNTKVQIIATLSQKLIEKEKEVVNCVTDLLDFD